MSSRGLTGDGYAVEEELLDHSPADSRADQRMAEIQSSRAGPGMHQARLFSLDRVGFGGGVAAGSGDPRVTGAIERQHQQDLATCGRKLLKLLTEQAQQAPGQRKRRRQILPRCPLPFRQRGRQFQQGQRVALGLGQHSLTEGGSKRREATGQQALCRLAV
jgi:hypothetical protein